MTGGLHVLNMARSDRFATCVGLINKDGSICVSSGAKRAVYPSSKNTKFSILGIPTIGSIGYVDIVLKNGNPVRMITVCSGGNKIPCFEKGCIYEYIKDRFRTGMEDDTYMFFLQYHTFVIGIICNFFTGTFELATVHSIAGNKLTKGYISNTVIDMYSFRWTDEQISKALTDVFIHNR
jgi:hypothetical protein